jgi:hypothetical protein
MLLKPIWHKKNHRHAPVTCFHLSERLSHSFIEAHEKRTVRNIISQLHMHIIIVE